MKKDIRRRYAEEEEIEKIVKGEKIEQGDPKEFKFKDIFKAWGYTWRFHRLLISALALIFSAIISFLLLRNSLAALIYNPQIEILLQFKFILAIILISCLFFLAKMCTAYSIHREVIYEKMFTRWKDIGEFFVKHIKTFLFFILGWIIIFAIIALAHLFFYVISNIPYIGPFWFSLLYLVPFLISVFFILTLVVLIFCDTYGAIIIGIEQKSAIDTIIALYHLVKDKGIYIIVCEVLSAIVGAIATGFILMIMYGAVIFTNFGAKFIMTDAFVKITLPKFFWFLSVIFSEESLCSGAGGIYTLFGFFLGLNLIIIASIGFSYFHTYMTSAETLIYLSSQDKFYPKKLVKVKKKKKRSGGYGGSTRKKKFTEFLREAIS